MSITVHFETRTGKRMSVTAEPGARLLDAALDELVPGIIGQCGGGITCATCHVKIEPEWRARLRPQSADEQELLGYVHNADDSSRLACQIRLTEALDGLEARVPGSD
ncbi:MAG: 2Fe-2S iron-sulfur cluster-binding protein [Pseudomonadota bacterium]